MYDHDKSFTVGSGSLEESRFPYNTDGSFCCSQKDYADIEHFFVKSNGVVKSAYCKLYWNYWFTDLSPIEMSSYFIHELIHAEFSRWLFDSDYYTSLNTDDFEYGSAIWLEIVEAKYGEVTTGNHHYLMKYFVDRIAADLWALNGETDLDRVEHYKYFAYDLMAPDVTLINEGFLTEAQLMDLKGKAENIVSNTICD